jgi:hypothetical protein
MIEHDSGTVRAISWSEVFPWLSLVRTFRLAIAVRALVLGAAAALLTATGWSLLGLAFSSIDAPATQWLGPFTTCPWLALTQAVPDRPPLLGGSDRMEREMPLESVSLPSDPVVGPWRLLTQPALEGLSNSPYADLPLRAGVCLLLCGLWGAAVWALFGAAICRTAAVQLAAGEQLGCAPAVRFAIRKWPSYFAAPLLPAGGVLLATIPVLVLGLIMKAQVGLLLGGLIWPLALAAGLLMTLLLLGVLFGWPLMWATISAEGTDSFDALSRSYAYVFQRPLHYLFYVFVAGVLGWLGWLLVQNFAAGVVWMSCWAAGWGCGSDQIKLILSGGKELGGMGSAGAMFVRFWVECVKLLAVGYLFSYFWTAAAAIYFLLRRDVDATEMDEVFLDADESEKTAGLPPVTTDQAGAPVVEGGTPEGRTNTVE